MTHDLIRNFLAGLRERCSRSRFTNSRTRPLRARQHRAEIGRGPSRTVLRVTAFRATASRSCRTDAPIFATQVVMDAASQDISILGSEENDDSEDPEFDS